LHIERKLDRTFDLGQALAARALSDLVRVVARNVAVLMQHAFVGAISHVASENGVLEMHHAHEERGHVEASDIYPFRILFFPPFF